MSDHLLDLIERDLLQVDLQSGPVGYYKVNTDKHISLIESQCILKLLLVHCPAMYLTFYQSCVVNLVVSLLKLVLFFCILRCLDRCKIQVESEAVSSW